MSLITPSVGNASGVAAHVPIEQRLDELGNRHRVALSQARVLDEVAKIAQASAVMGPGYIISRIRGQCYTNRCLDPSNSDSGSDPRESTGSELHCES